jgi:RNA polymerase sigma-70 factor (ECF subfamily)
VAFAVCRDTCTAQDAVQEAFLSIWVTRGSYRPERGSVAAWLLTVVRHRAIDLARRERAATARVNRGRVVEVTPVDDAAERVLADERADDLKGLLARLPPAQRNVIVLAFYDGLSHTEIAAKLGLPPGTVKSRMRLGLDKLRGSIDR